MRRNADADVYGESATNCTTIGDPSAARRARTSTRLGFWTLPTYCTLSTCTRTHGSAATTANCSRTRCSGVTRGVRKYTAITSSRATTPPIK
jgi:hypothetical protein